MVNNSRVDLFSACEKLITSSRFQCRNKYLLMCADLLLKYVNNFFFTYYPRHKVRWLNETSWSYKKDAEKKCIG